MPKTGLGSSATLVASLTAAMLIECQLITVKREAGQPVTLSKDSLEAGHNLAGLRLGFV